MLFYNQMWILFHNFLFVCCTKLILHWSNRIIFFVKFLIWNSITLIINSNNTLDFVPISAVMMNTLQRKSQRRRCQSILSLSVIPPWAYHRNPIMVSRKNFEQMKSIRNQIIHSSKCIWIDPHETHISH